MTWIKICGITNLEDALTAVEAGADALGFVFYDQSPRRVEVTTVREIVSELPERIEKVGVFVGADCDYVCGVVSETRLTAVQLQGKSAIESVWKDTRPTVACVGVSKVIAAMPGDSLKDGDVLIHQRPHEGIFALLLDAQTNGVIGGTGITFDWEATRGIVQTISLLVPVIVAGGLTSLNVGGAIKLFQPFGVDVSSGVEARPGKKDPARIRAFVQAVRRADKNSA